MSNLDNLMKKVRADGELKAQTIINDATRDAQALIEKAENDAQAESRKITSEAESEGGRIKALTLSAKKIEIRDRMLAAKQDTIDRVLRETRMRLETMSQADYEAFLLRYLREISFQPGEILIVPEAYANLDMDALNAKLAAAGKPSLTLRRDAHAVNGFKLIKTDIENDNSFDALIDYYRSTLEQLVVERLF